MLEQSSVLIGRFEFIHGADPHAVAAAAAFALRRSQEARAAELDTDQAATDVRAPEPIGPPEAHTD